MNNRPSKLTVTSMVGFPRGERPPLLPSFCDIKNKTALRASSTLIFCSKYFKTKLYSPIVLCQLSLVAFRLL